MSETGATARDDRWFMQLPRSLLAIIILSRACLFALILRQPDFAVRTYGDAAGYLQLASNLWKYHAYSFTLPAVYRPETTYPPGYALFLAPFTTFSYPFSVLLPILAQCLLGIVMSVFLWNWLALIKDKRVAKLGTLLFALDWSVVVHNGILLSDTLMMFFMVLALWQGERARQSGRIDAAAGAGLGWGLASMVKPICLYVPLIVLAFGGRRLRQRWLSLLAAAYFLPMGWIFRNRVQTGHAVFSSMQGIHLLYEASLVETTRTGQATGVIFRELQASADRNSPAGYSNDADKSIVYTRVAMPILRRRPDLLLKNHLWGAVRLLVSTGTELFWQLLSTTSSQENLLDYHWGPRMTGQGTLRLMKVHPWLIFFQVGYSAFLAGLYIAFAAGIIILIREGRRLDAAFLAVLPAYFMSVTSHVGSQHYRLAMMPALAAGAALSWARRGTT